MLDTSGDCGYFYADFLMKVHRQNPESEFNIKKLSKNMICEFIDEGYKPLNDFEDSIKTEERDILWILRFY